MVEENKGVTNGAVSPAVAPETSKTEVELTSMMQTAIKSGDYKAVAKVAGDIVKLQKAKEVAEQTEKEKILVTKTVQVKVLFDSLTSMLISGHATLAEELKPFLAELRKLVGTELDKADGIWYVSDFGEKLTSCRLMKSAPKALKGSGNTGGGGGKKFAVGTAELLIKFGTEVYKGTQTFQQAWDANVDKNWRYAIRETLLKKEGLIS